MNRWARLAAEAREELEAPPPPPVSRRKKVHKMNPRERVMVRWESVRAERDAWLQPFYKLPLERAMAYLEDIRKIAEQAGYILNERIGNDPNKVRCAGPRCGKDLSGLQPNGRPKWIAKKDFRDKTHPEIIHSVYFCCELHHNEWVKNTQGAGGTTQ